MTVEPIADRDAQVRRAVLATVRQELSAPVAVILGYAEMMLEDAARPDMAEFADDLRRIHAAGTQLAGFIDRFLGAGEAGTDGMTADAFKAWFRHDLRTPINAVRGYAEMMLEAAEERGFATFATDLRRLIAASGAFLDRVEGLVTLEGVAAPVAQSDSRPLQGLEVLKESLLPEVASAIRPLADGHATRRVHAGRILVADDNEANRDLLSRRLERGGHLVVTAEDGMQALDIACAREFDLILLDLMMPRLNGYEVLVRLRAAERTAHVPVIMISALDEMDSVVRCIEAGAEDYLPKPWNPVILQARVNACIEKKQLRDRDRSHLLELEVAHKKSESLLLNILPSQVVRRLHQGEAVIADRYDDVTVLFSDVVSFTRLSASLAAPRVVEVLNSLFSEFDRIAHELGIEKIKTVGDAYMAVAGLPEPCADHAMRVATMALRMLHVVQRGDATVGKGLQVRIGMHTGPVVAGIIGTHKFAYDVWGDAVNVASRMEAQGLPGEIQASHETFLRLRDRFTWVPRGEIEVKGKGPMETFLLKGVA
jgi:class 3 adenylate cyclase/CheY-like chemotaxis protein